MKDITKESQSEYRKNGRLHSLMIATEELERMERARVALVKLCKEYGASWHEIGASMGLSKSQAFKRFAEKIKDDNGDQEKP